MQFLPVWDFSGIAIKHYVLFLKVLTFYSFYHNKKKLQSNSIF